MFYIVFVKQLIILDMANTFTPSVQSSPRFILLESGIAYDWDDYDVYGSVLFDIENNEITTTKYGHGTGMSVSGNVMSVKDAISAGVVTCEQLINVMIKSLGISFSNASIQDIATRHTIESPMGIPVNVVGGRKYKGFGYYICSAKEPVRYGLGAWQGHVTYKHIIYSPEKNDYFTVNSFSYLKFNDETIDAWNKSIRENIENNLSTVLNLAHAWAYNMSYSACDTKNYYALITRYSNLGYNKNTPVSEVVANATKEYIERKKLERENKMNQELPNLIDWVRSKGYKNTEEEIVAEAKRIWLKNN